VITGGTAPYNVSVSPGGAIVTPPVVTTSGGNVGISGLANGSGITTVIILDSGLGAQQQTKTATISCS